MLCIKEYCIYIRQGSGKSFIFDTCNNIFSVKNKLNEMTSVWSSHDIPFFVDNDFFDNKFPYAPSFKYVCVKEREVSKWEKYCDTVEQKNENNIIYFNDFLNS